MWDVSCWMADSSWASWLVWWWCNTLACWCMSLRCFFLTMSMPMLASYLLFRDSASWQFCQVRVLFFCFRLVMKAIFLRRVYASIILGDQLQFNCKMDLKNFAVSFASAEKMIGSGFVQLADNVQSVNRQIKELDQKYEELRAEIEALKAIKPQVVKETVVTEVVVKENSQPQQAQPQLVKEPQPVITKTEQPTVLETHQSEPPKVTAQALKASSSGPPQLRKLPSLPQTIPNPTDSPSLAPPQPSYLQLIQKKIQQLQSRLQQSQRNYQMGLQSNTRKIAGLGTDNANFQGQIRKNQCNIDLCNKKIGELQEELLEFKLKKEAKLQKIISGSMIMDKSMVGGGNGGSGGNGAEEAFKKMVIEKIKSMSRDIAESVSKEQYVTDQEQLAKKLSKINDDLADRITTETYDNLIYYLEKNQNKQLQSLAIQRKGTIDGTPEQGSHLLIKVANLSKELEASKRKQQQHETVLSELVKTGKQRNKDINQLKEEIVQHAEQFKDINHAVKEALEGMRQHIEKKVGQLEIEVLDMKQKNQNKQKVQTFKRSDPTSMSQVDSISALPKDDGGLRKSSDVSKKDLHNQMAQHTKKLNKLYLSSNQQKQQMQRFTEQIQSQLDEIKVELEKKADHETVKKSFVFVENKVNQIINVMVQNGQTQTEGDSLIAKKHWSCLSCDKNLDKYEGRLGQVRFTSVFPPRFDSPRIGGYYKQNENQKDYKKLFIGFKDSSKDRTMRQELPPLKTDR